MKKNILIIAYVLALSLASAFVVVDGAGGEPFIEFRFSDAFVQIGMGIALMVLWLQLAAWLLFAAFTRRIARPWLAATVWAGLMMFYLWQSPVGYVHDITKFVVQKQ